MDGFQKSIKSKMESFSPWPLNVGVPQNLVLGRLPTACFFPGGPPLVHGPSKALLCWWLPQNPAAQTSGHHTLSLSPGLHPPGAVTRDTSDFKGRKCQALTPPHPQTSPPPPSCSQGHNTHPAVWNSTWTQARILEAYRSFHCLCLKPPLLSLVLLTSCTGHLGPFHSGISDFAGGRKRSWVISWMPSSPPFLLVWNF